MDKYQFTPGDPSDYQPRITNAIEITSSELMNAIVTDQPSQPIALLLDNGVIFVGTITPEVNSVELIDKYFITLVEDAASDLSEAASNWQDYVDDFSVDDEDDDDCPNCGAPMAAHKGCTTTRHDDCGCPPRH